MPEGYFGWITPGQVIAQTPPDIPDVEVEVDPWSWIKDIFSNNNPVDPEGGKEDEVWDFLEEKLESSGNWILDQIDWVAEQDELPGIKQWREGLGEFWQNPLTPYEFQSAPSPGQIASAPLRGIQLGMYDLEENWSFGDFEVGGLAQFDAYGDTVGKAAEMVEHPNFGRGVLNLLIMRKLGGIKKTRENRRPPRGDRTEYEQRRSREMGRAHRMGQLKNAGRIALSLGLVVAGGAIGVGIDTAQGISAGRQGQIPGLDDAIAEAERKANERVAAAERRADEAEEQAAEQLRMVLDQLDLGGLGSGTIYGPFVREKGSFVEQVKGTIDTGGVVSVWTKEKIRQGKVIHALMGAEAQRTADLMRWIHG